MCLADLPQGLLVLVPLLLEVFQLRKGEQSFTIVSERVRNPPTVLK